MLYNSLSEIERTRKEMRKMNLGAAFLVSVLLTGPYFVEGLTELKCGHRIYNLITPKFWRCCGGRLYPRKANFLACCGNDQKCYNPMSQYCCGGVIFPRLNSNSACCNGMPYQRGMHGCCHGKILKLKVQDCCRKEAYNISTQICCEGNILQKNESHLETQCCGTGTYDARKEMCCGEKAVERVGGEHSKCCGMKSYDSRTQDCCMNKIIPRDLERDQCCNGVMYNSKDDMCCGGEVKPLSFGKRTGCCRIGSSMAETISTRNFSESKMSKILGGVHVIYDHSKSICCSGHLGTRTSSDTGCCGRKPYNVNTHICCLNQVHERRRGRPERCCNDQKYDRKRHICCHGNLHEVHTQEAHYQFCCGEKVYDRRKAQCDSNMKIRHYKCADPVKVYEEPGE